MAPKLGGVAWARVVVALREYLAGAIKRRIFVDRCFSLEHNAGCVFDKLWATGGVRPVLDAHGMDDYATLLHNASKQVRVLWRRCDWVARQEHDPTWLGVQPTETAASLACVRSLRRRNVATSKGLLALKQEEARARRNSSEGRCMVRLARLRVLIAVLSVLAFPISGRAASDGVLCDYTYLSPPAVFVGGPPAFPRTLACQGAIAGNQSEQRWIGLQWAAETAAMADIYVSDESTDLIHVWCEIRPAIANCQTESTIAATSEVNPTATGFPQYNLLVTLPEAVTVRLYLSPTGVSGADAGVHYGVMAGAGDLRLFAF